MVGDVGIRRKLAAYHMQSYFRFGGKLILRSGTFAQIFRTELKRQNLTGDEYW
jgi:hypothetical protein